MKQKGVLISSSAKTARAAASLAAVLLCASLGPGRQEQSDAGAREAASRQIRRGALNGATVEPTPPIVAEIASVELRRHARGGGVGSLLLKVASSVHLEEVVIDLRLPEGLILADGGRARSWRSGLREGRMLSLPIEILAARDGSYVIEADIVGSTGDQKIRRGIAYPVDIGATRTRPVYRNGAHEYRAVPGRGER